MLWTRKPGWLPMLSCVVMAGASNLASAQFGITIDESGSVRLQNGDKPPLVVGPGQSFGGTLTPQGFQGVKVGPDSVAVPVNPVPANPFQAAPAPPPVASNRSGMKIRAGDVSITLPQTRGPVAVGISDPAAAPSMSTAYDLARTARPDVALRQVDQILTSVRSPDALQLRATLLMADRPQEAAASVYEALSTGPAWTWGTLRSRYATQEEVVAAYRTLRKTSTDSPTLENMFLLAWWERMLQHPAESMAALQKARAQRPEDPLMNRLARDWAAVETADAPPMAQ